MLTTEQINTIHRLHWSEHWSVRKIACHLHLGRRTIAKYLAAPARRAAPRQRASKLDPFNPTITELLEQDPHASAVVIAQRLRPLGFTGGLSILKEYLHAVRAQTAAKRALCAHGARARGALRNRLGSLRCTSLPRSPAQALCLLSGGMPQPQTVCGVHAQPELRDVRPLSYPSPVP